MLKHLMAIAAIFCGASIAWMILGGTLVERTSDASTSEAQRLGDKWGEPQVQAPPSVSARVGKKIVAVPIEPHPGWHRGRPAA